MHDASLFVPETISNALRANLSAGLRALAEALDAQELDGRFMGATAVAGGRYDDRVHLRVVIDIAALVVRPLTPESHAAALED